MEIDDSGNLIGKIGYYDPNGVFHWLASVALNWNTLYKFFLVRSRSPMGDIYLNMYIMNANELILASGSVLVNADANHPYRRFNGCYDSQTQSCEME